MEMSNIIVMSWQRKSLRDLPPPAVAMVREGGRKVWLKWISSCCTSRLATE